MKVAEERVRHDPGGHDVSRTVEIVNKRGLHARASARLAREAGPFVSQISVCKDDTCVTATSIMGLMMLGAAKGDSVDVRASGADAHEAVKSLSALISDRFGESE